MGTGDPACAILDRIARASCRDDAPVLPPAYLAAVRRVEDLAVNQAGADKTWVGRVMRDALRIRRAAARRP